MLERSVTTETGQQPLPTSCCSRGHAPQQAVGSPRWLPSFARSPGTWCREFFGERFSLMQCFEPNWVALHTLIDTLNVPVLHYRIYFRKTCKYISCTANKNFFVHALINASRVLQCIARYTLCTSNNMLRASSSTSHHCDSIDRHSHSRAMARKDR